MKKMVNLILSDLIFEVTFVVLIFHIAQNFSTQHYVAHSSIHLKGQNQAMVNQQIAQMEQQQNSFIQQNKLQTGVNQNWNSGISQQSQQNVNSNWNSGDNNTQVNNNAQSMNEYASDEEYAPNMEQNQYQEQYQNPDQLQYQQDTNQAPPQDSSMASAEHSSTMGTVMNDINYGMTGYQVYGMAKSGINKLRSRTSPIQAIEQGAGQAEGRVVNAIENNSPRVIQAVEQNAGRFGMTTAQAGQEAIQATATGEEAAAGGLDGLGSLLPELEAALPEVAEVAMLA